MNSGIAVVSYLYLLAVISLTFPAYASERGLSPAGKLFIKEAASGNLMEVQLGKVARDKGRSQDVKDFGDLMVLDHSKANVELTTIATQMNLRLPLKVARKHAVIISELSNLSGNAFDKKYLQTVAKIHLKNITRYKKAAKNLKDQDLKTWAVNRLPVLDQHLQLARQVAQKPGHS
jgi:putative membrane protein